jgi:hypothetical protein
VERKERSHSQASNSSVGGRGEIEGSTLRESASGVIYAFGLLPTSLSSESPEVRCQLSI